MMDHKSYIYIYPSLSLSLYIYIYLFTILILILNRIQAHQNGPPVVRNKGVVLSMASLVGGLSRGALLEHLSWTWGVGGWCRLVHVCLGLNSH